MGVNKIFIGGGSRFQHSPQQIGAAFRKNTRQFAVLQNISFQINLATKIYFDSTRSMYKYLRSTACTDLFL